MRSVIFPQANQTWTAPEGWDKGECNDLPAFVDEFESISCWEPTDLERAAIAAGGPVWLRVVCQRQPPVDVTALTPFRPLEDAEAEAQALDAPIGVDAAMAALDALDECPPLGPCCCNDGDEIDDYGMPQTCGFCRGTGMVEDERATKAARRVILEALVAGKGGL